ncbi:hypothetical protein ASE63_08020 [Bosea sp. Root381]|uniref:hypothetical protein n=1 Tax=Bosea sp. Root381 TaxID=1736524 RepID=UPI000700D522|nr:hypothetical protein [Bosea sp. Root381]KRE02296.1 hypothetical protein ASE63_08020 [Bosea sp. Root381]
MPIFKLTTDVEGDVCETVAEFPDAKAAKDDLQLGMIDAIVGKLPNGPRVHLFAKVEDDSGTELYRASLIFTADNAPARN